MDRSFPSTGLMTEDSCCLQVETRRASFGTWRLRKQSPPSSWETRRKTSRFVFFVFSAHLNNTKGWNAVPRRVFVECESVWTNQLPGCQQSQQASSRSARTSKVH